MATGKPKAIVRNCSQDSERHNSSSEEECREFKNKNKYKTPLPLLLSLGEGLSAIHSCRTAQAPRGDQAAADDDWASKPAARPIRCLGSETIHERAARRRVWAAPGCGRFLWSHTLPPGPSALAWCRASPSQERPQPEAAEHAGPFESLPGQGRAAEPSASGAVAMKSFFLLIGVMCFQFPSTL